MPRSSTTFQKGQSGNPSGRSKKRRDIEALAQQHTDTAIRALAEVAAQSEDLRAKVAASVALLDRGYGKPSQTLKGDSESPLFPAIQVYMPDNKRHGTNGNGNGHRDPATAGASGKIPGQPG